MDDMDENKRLESFLDVPIDVNSAWKVWLDSHVGKPSEGHETVVTGGLSIASQVFVAIREMMDVIVRGTDWNKKTRIVLEYDPQSKKMELITFGSADETQSA